MGIPNQVKQRSQQANEHFQRQAQQGKTDVKAEQADHDSQQPQTEEAENAQHDEKTQQPAPAQAQPSAETTDDIEELRQELRKSMQRFDTLKGMIGSRDAEIQRLQGLLSSFEQAQKKPAEPEPSRDEADEPTPIDKADRDLFGADMVEMVDRRIAARFKALESRLGQTEASARQSQEYAQTSMQERFNQRLTERLPNWQEIDSDEEFREWVGQSRARVAIIKGAVANYEADAIADLFEQFIALTGKGRPSAPARSLEHKVAPSKGRTSKSDATQPEKKVWKRSEIAQVFANRRNLSQKEFNELQQDIFAAQKEGRVDYDH